MIKKKLNIVLPNSSENNILIITFTCPHIDRMPVNKSQVVEMKILMDLYALRSPEWPKIQFLLLDLCMGVF